MADSDPRFTTRTNSSNMCRNNYSNKNYMRSVCKLLFFTFFLIAIPCFPSQAPDFINQTIFNKFWELVHLMFIGIAVSYGLFCRRSDDFDNGSSNLDDSMSCVSSFFEDGVSNSMYYSGQGKDGFFDVKNGSFENPFEENVVQAWSSKYFQGEPKVVLDQPNCGIEKYGESESSSFVGSKPLGLPVRSLKSRVVTRVSPEFGNGSSESSGSHVKESSDGSNKSRNGRFGDLSSEDLEGKFNESGVLDSPIPWRSRSGRTRERVCSNVDLTSHIRPHSVDEVQFESLKLQSLQSTVSFSSQDSSQSQSHSPCSLSPSHSSSSEPESKIDLVRERSPRRSFPPPSPSVSSQASAIASHSRSGRTRERVHSSVTRPSHSRPLSVDETQFGSLKPRSLRSTVSFSSQVSSGSHSPSSLSPSHSSSSESPKSKMSELVEERSPRQPVVSPPPSPSVPKPMSSKASANASHSRSRRMRERVHSNVTPPSHIRPPSVDETQFELLKPQSLLSTVSFSSQVSSASHSPSSLSPSHSSSSESPKSKMTESVNESSLRRSFPPPSPSVPKPLSSKASANVSLSQQYSDGSLSATPAWECFEDELKEFRDSIKDESSGSKEQNSDSFKFDAKPAAHCKASSRGKSVRTFRSFRASISSIRGRDAGDDHEDCKKGKLTMGSDEIEEAYTVKTEPKIEGRNSLSIGFDRKNLGGESDMPKRASPENHKREIQDSPGNPAAELGEDSDDETMSGTFSIAGSEVDRKAGEFIAKFKEQIRLQRTSSMDTTRELNITDKYFR